MDESRQTEKVKLVGGAANGQVLEVDKGRLALEAVGESGTGLKAVCTAQTYRRTDETEDGAVIFRVIEDAEARQSIDETPVEQVIGSAIEILRIQKGDTVIVRAEMSDPRQMEFVVNAMGALFQERGLGPEDVSLLIIPSNLDLQVLNTEQMKRNGWVRASRIEIPGQNGIRH